MIKYIVKLIKQSRCNHNWKPKGFGTFDSKFITSNEYRCTKCKKIKYTFKHI